MSSWRRGGYSRKRLKDSSYLKPTCSPARPTWLQLAHEKLDAADGEILERPLDLNLDCPPGPLWLSNCRFIRGNHWRRGR